jgi:nucleoid-associated protein YgaU
MSDKEIRDEMENMRQPRTPALAKRAEPTSDKAQAAREARMAKMANKEEGKSASPMVEETTEATAQTAALLAEHTVASGDTLSHISQKYYNSATHWKAIYEANKETIGDNPSLIRNGQVLKIPPLSG